VKRVGNEVVVIYFMLWQLFRDNPVWMTKIIFMAEL